MKSSYYVATVVKEHIGSYIDAYCKSKRNISLSKMVRKSSKPSHRKILHRFFIFGE